MSNWIKSQGNLMIKDGNIRLMVSHDFIMYYKSLVDKEFKIFAHTPAHGGHITVYRADKSKPLTSEQIKFVKNIQRGNPIEFEYNNDIIVGGQTKSFTNWYMLVRSAKLDEIAEYLKINQKWHLTVCNTKGGIRPYIWFKQQ